MINKPLAEVFRPQLLEQITGQEHLLGQDGIITRILKGGNPLSILLWGPPGCGKTTLARLYAKAFNAEFLSFSAVFHGTADLKKVVDDIKRHPLLQTKKIIFVDEIHRFNKQQQDSFLPFIEDGTFVLVGATTENPSFSLNDALLSRLRVLTLKPLSEQALDSILSRYEKECHLLPLTLDSRTLLIHMAQGDGRHLLNLVENIKDNKEPLSVTELETLLQKRAALYDKHGEKHHNLISALHKSVRGSDPDAALYWLARMLQGGEAPQFLSRRMVRMAVEDIGLADPDALTITLNAWKAYDKLGSPEGDLALAEAIIYLALAPKSNAVYTAFSAAQKLASETTHLDPPKHILNAPTSLMKNLGYGKNYNYDHDTEEGFSGQNYFPDNLERPHFYKPIERGFEREMKKRLAYFSQLRARLSI